LKLETAFVSPEVSPMLVPQNDNCQHVAIVETNIGHGRSRLGGAGSRTKPPHLLHTTVPLGRVRRFGRLQSHSTCCHPAP
jgi:hypothetical protein